MRIGIDYTSAAHQGAGIGRLTRNIVGALAQIDRANEYTLFVQGSRITHPPLIPHPRNVASGIPNDNVREVRTRITERWWHRIWHRLHLPLPVERVIGPVDLFHSPDFTLPPVRRGTRTMVTVHDLSFLRLPHCFEPALLDYLVENVPRAVRRADWILADSESTRHDLVELLDAPDDRITVIYPGVEHRFQPVTDAEELDRVRAKYHLPPHFILSVGTIQPRKNYVGLTKAFADLEAEDVALVIVGGRGWLYEDVFSTVQDLNLQDRVLLPGFVDDVDLPALYSLADLFVLPSLYEGFGIPLLEAMACGTPAITADNSSLPEVAQDACRLVETGSVEALTEAMNLLLADTNLLQRLAERGLAQAARFSWEQSAASLLATYRHVCGE
jgi:glycosyltransferase involved in cell wall biosynthesis